MTFDNRANESVALSLQIILYQINLLSQEILSVLQNKFRVIIDDLDNIRGLDFVILSQQIKKTYEIADLTGENTSTLCALKG